MALQYRISTFINMQSTRTSAIAKTITVSEITVNRNKYHSSLYEYCLNSNALEFEEQFMINFEKNSSQVSWQKVNKVCGHSQWLQLEMFLQPLNWQHKNRNVPDMLSVSQLEWKVQINQFWKSAILLDIKMVWVTIRNVWKWPSLS